MTKPKLTRRQFIKSAVGTAIALSIPVDLVGCVDARASSHGESLTLEHLERMVEQMGNIETKPHYLHFHESHRDIIERYCTKRPTKTMSGYFIEV